MKAELKGNGWRIVRYNNYYHFYGAKMIARVKQLTQLFIVCKVNGVEYVQVKVTDFPVKLAI